MSVALLDIVERACAGASQTRDVYDPTVLPLMRLYGFYASGRSHLPSDREIAAALDAMGPRVIALDRAAGTLGLTKAGAALDLGSIGKGWAIDRAVDALRGAGVALGLVDVGGNVYGLGTPARRRRRLVGGRARTRRRGQVVRVFTLRDAAVATSGNDEQWSTLDGDAHRAPPRRARGAPDGGAPVSASVLARTGIASDEGSTRAFLLGPGLDPSRRRPRHALHRMTSMSVEIAGSAHVRARGHPSRPAQGSHRGQPDR